jgi:hypothetical protein
MENGFQRAVADPGRREVGSGDGLAGGLAETVFGEFVRLEEWEWRGQYGRIWRFAQGLRGGENNSCFSERTFLLIES